MNDSKELWLSISSNLEAPEMKLGIAASTIFMSDPRMIAITAARYKFVGKMIAGSKDCLEVGCGDGFGAPIAAQDIGKLICADIDEKRLQENKERMKQFENIDFKYHDFRSAVYPTKFESAYLIDVIEHIYKEEEEVFLSNIAASLTPYGTCIIGTPNITSEQYASKHSRVGHVNLKSHVTLKVLGEKYFHKVFLFSMNDEVIHTGFSPMAHFIWAICVCPKKQNSET